MFKKPKHSTKYTPDSAAKKILSAFQAFSILKNHLRMRAGKRMIDAKNLVAAAIKKVSADKASGEGYKYVRLHWPVSEDKKSRVFVYGNFTSPPWKIGVEMQYSEHERVYTANLRFKEGQRFKFMVDGVYKISKDYEYKKAGPNMETNIFTELSYYAQKRKNSILMMQRELSVPPMATLHPSTIFSQYSSEGKDSPIVIMKGPHKNSIIKVRKGHSNTIDLGYGEDISYKQLNDSVGGAMFFHRVDTEMNLMNHAHGPRKPSGNDISIDPEEEKREEEKTIPRQKSTFREAPGEEPETSPEAVEIKEESPSPFQEIITMKKIEEKTTLPGEKPKRFRFIYGAVSLPRAGTNGEDAHLECKRALGVSDGVSGWYQYGIDSSEFSLQIMKGSLDQIAHTLNEDEKEKTYTKLEPMPILENSYSHVTAIGSATATIVVINEDKLDAVNLGDSGFVCFTKKGGEYVNSGVSKEQQHNFNTPYQLSNLPSPEDIKELESRVEAADLVQLEKIIKNQELCQDTPSMADSYSMQLHEGDVVVLGTDGLFDNLFKDEIKMTVREIMKTEATHSESLARKLAVTLADRAHEKSISENVKIPFQIKYQKEYRSSFPRGKEDDITAVVGIVKSQFPFYHPQICLLYTSPSPRDATLSRMPSSA
eukprot:TRINITY_DN4165_c0_g1_i1.p1 TRINITY_DN4165_c0_g1~~TRINITY_DN4165_c0_g1_i1.p1  ORF type:complete len:652 (-),score=127.18 TRINITY_DN4165_c0_g1_i1:10-1965(-)